jgi:hypothetical protein
MEGKEKNSVIKYSICLEAPGLNNQLHGPSFLLLPSKFSSRATVEKRKICEEKCGRRKVHIKLWGNDDGGKKEGEEREKRTTESWGVGKIGERERAK